MINLFIAFLILHEFGYDWPWWLLAAALYAGRVWSHVSEAKKVSRLLSLMQVLAMIQK